jgi:Na+/melibiose symporter-like transporter
MLLSTDILLKQRLAYCLENRSEETQFETVYDHLLHYYTKVLGMSEDDAIDVIFDVSKG